MFRNHSKQYVADFTEHLELCNESLNGVKRGVLTNEYMCIELLTALIGLTIFIFMSLIKW